MSQTAYKMSSCPPPPVESVNLVGDEGFLPFAPPCINQAAIDEVVDCLRSGWLATGPKVVKFEQNLQQYFQRKHVITFSSATGGLLSVLHAWDIKGGDEVITTPLTFAATLNVISMRGAKPVLVDVDPTTYNIDINKIKAAITERTKVIMPVHFTGLSVNLDEIYNIAQEHGLRVLEDAAHAAGGDYNHKRIGSFGDVQVFSFYAHKNMTTGEGGCVTTDNDEFAAQLRALRFHGINRDAWNRYAKGGSQYYDIEFPGYKMNMMDLQAALGIHQLAQLDAFVARRRYLMNRYLELLQGWPEIVLPTIDEGHAGHLFAPLICSSKISRDEFMQRMREMNIGTGLHYLPVHLYSYYRKTLGYGPGSFPNAEYVGNHIVSLPLFSSMTDQQQDRVVSAMAEILDVA